MSDIVPLETPQPRPFVDGEGYVLPWALEIRKNIDVFSTKGKRRTNVCTVYVHDLEYTYVPIP